MADSGRVAFDVAAARAEPTGVGVYVRELGRELASLDPSAVGYIGVRRGGPFDTDTAGLTDGLPPCRYMASGRYLPWLQRHADRDARSLGAALVHYTSALAPIGGRLPCIVTVHDLSVLRDPLHHPPLRVARVLWMAYAVRRARSVIVPSRSTARDVMRVFHIAPQRLAVVPHAAPRVLEASEEPGDAAELARHGVVRRHYLLATGGLDARKNPVRLVQALYGLEGSDAALRLVIVGPRGFRADAIAAEIGQLDVDHRVTVAGYVPDGNLDALMRNAAAFVFVSLHEGFGLPILEAMSAGVPVVASGVSSMPEVAGHDAVLVDPRDPADIRRGISEAVARRAELASPGIDRARSRTWADVARETVEVYSGAMRHSRR